MNKFSLNWPLGQFSLWLWGVIHIWCQRPKVCSDKRGRGLNLLWSFSLSPNKQAELFWSDILWDSLLLQEHVTHSCTQQIKTKLHLNLAEREPANTYQIVFFVDVYSVDFMVIYKIKFITILKGTIKKILHNSGPWSLVPTVKQF